MPKQVKKQLPQSTSIAISKNHPGVSATAGTPRLYRRVRQMNRTVSRVLWVIAGVLLIIAGVICLVNPGTAIASLAVLLGIAMLFSGIVDIVIFAKGRNYMAGAGWFLVDGILTVLLSLFIMNSVVHSVDAAVDFRHVAALFRHYQVCQFF